MASQIEMLLKQGRKDEAAKLAATQNAPAPGAGTSGVPLDPRLPGIVEYLRGERTGDVNRGMQWGKDKFGMGNADMAEIILARKNAAFGTDPRTALMRDQGVAGINSQMATGLRGLRGMQASSGVRGGAAAAQAIPIAQDAARVRQGLERDLVIEDFNRRDRALGDLEQTVTGERAGHLGTAFGFAGLGAGDRSNALSWLLGQDLVAATRGDIPGGAGNDPDRFKNPLPNNPVSKAPVWQPAGGGNEPARSPTGKKPQWDDPTSWDWRVSAPKVGGKKKKKGGADGDPRTPW